LSQIWIIVRIQEPDLHRIFGISAGYLKKLWTDFNEILCVDRCGGLVIWLGFEPDPDQSPDPASGYGFKIARLITLKVMDIGYFSEILRLNIL